MGCQTEVDIGDYFTFSVTTHDPDTGVLTDADAVPAYRIYEDEIAVPILTGNMAKLDDVGTTGFYTERIACTSANGFEDGKSYNIDIVATVDGDQGGITYAFRAMTPAWTVPAVAIAAAMTGSTIVIRRGDSLTIAITALGDMTTAAKTWFTVKKRLSDADTAAIIQIDTTTGLVYLNGLAVPVARQGNGVLTITDAITGAISITLQEAETDDLVIAEGLYYDVQMLNAAGTVSTLTQGWANVVGDVTRVIV